MKQTFRWYGPDDPVSLSDIRQAGATGVVTALHHVRNGEVWALDEIQKRKNEIENCNLCWSVVESVAVHEDIKTKSGNFQQYVENYKRSLENLAKCGINIVCYNFMPVLDWTRTSLEYELQNGSKALRFDMTAFVAFEIYILQRHNAKTAYSEDQLKKAKDYFKTLSEEVIVKLTKTIIAGLPGAEEGYTLDQFRKALHAYDEINAQELKENLVAFLREIIPVAIENDVFMCLHPDDPPFSILGLPRIASTEADYGYIFEQVSSTHNGMTFCSGSLGVILENNLENIFKRFANRIHFIHLRSTKRNEEGSFYEANHLEGDVDMFSVVKVILEEEVRRKKKGKFYDIPMRPDHGHQLLDDLRKDTNPGYSAIGRLKGLAEIRGLEVGIRRSFNL